MRKRLLTGILWMVVKIATAQLPVPADSLYVFIKYNSIHRSNVNWVEADRSFREQLQSSQSLEDTLQCFVSVLRQLKDVHSQFYLNHRYFGHYPEMEDSVLNRIKPIHDLSLAETNKLYGTMVSRQIGYIRIPTIQIQRQEEIQDYARALTKLVLGISAKSKKGIILDLRLNGGGNLYPMLSGLAPLLGNTTIGYEKDNRDSISRHWEIKNGNFVIGGYQTTSLKTKMNPTLTRLPLVIITGPVTKSAGSMVAIAFRGRSNTLFIGEPTADGYTTSNGYFQFAPNLYAHFATHFVADRNKTVYKTSVNPDVILNSKDNFSTLAFDGKIIYAISYLKKIEREWSLRRNKNQ